ncbi:sulfate transport system ATP-binding protein [Skermanella aerolata]|uniref:sulfate/molybdate ABC transporter ATP-binding protein n=1 Tax=Skermanella aerolata TaxID=393310 RepID=UPI003D1F3C47
MVIITIDLQCITKRFGNYVAIDGVDLRIAEGELVALLGPSGSGKTTLLRIIAGLEVPDTGTVLLGGEDALQRHMRHRQVGFVFQHYSLFRHMTVFANVAFGLRVRPRRQRPSEAEIAERVHRLLHLVQLDELADHYPSQLSGGQRQRTALARSLAIEPRILLLDEPFGALDAKVRKELRRWLRRLHETMRITSVFVTHDQEEALELADRIVLMNQGRIEQVGAPAEVYRAPASPFVSEFLGDINRIECLIEGGQVYVTGGGAPLGSVPAGYSGAAVIYVRPHDIELMPVTFPADGGGTVRYLHEVGPIVRAEVDYAGALLDVVLPESEQTERPLRVGNGVDVRIRRGFVFPKGAGKQAEPMRLAPYRGGGPRAIAGPPLGLS